MKRLIILLGVLCLVVFVTNAFALTVSVDSVQGKRGDENVAVPIRISNFTANDIRNMELTLKYAPGPLRVVGVESGALTGSWSRVYKDDNTAGVVKICLISLAPLPVQAGAVVVVKFAVRHSAASGRSDLTLTRAFFKLSLADVINNGKFTVIYTPPSIEPIPPSTIKVGQLLAFNIIALGERLTFSASGVPSGAVFNPKKETFSWAPKAGQEGEYNVIFTVTDLKGNKASRTANIKVNP
ncbi:MAG: putative Ig domain-containing protein [Candidatus Omnitrophota bacterium]